jgi:hypothetical protein
MEERVIIELYQNGKKVDEEDISSLLSRDLNGYFHAVAAKGLRYKLRRVTVPVDQVAEEAVQG